MFIFSVVTLENFLRISKQLLKEILKESTHWRSSRLLIAYFFIIHIIHFRKHLSTEFYSHKYCDYTVIPFVLKIREKVRTLQVCPYEVWTLKVTLFDRFIDLERKNDTWLAMCSLRAGSFWHVIFSCRCLFDRDKQTWFKLSSFRRLGQFLWCFHIFLKADLYVDLFILEKKMRISLELNEETISVNKWVLQTSLRYLICLKASQYWTEVSREIC